MSAARVRVLDLFCKEGGASEGYRRAFPDAEIVGIDIEPQKRYPFTFMRADAMACLENRPFIESFDLVHASPPCQDKTTLRSLQPAHGTGWILAATIARLKTYRVAWVVENVPGAELDMGGAFTVLCGSSFGLKVRRHRLFATSFPLLSLPCRHAEQGTPWGVYGTGGGGQMTRGYKATPAQAREAMGIDWMSRAGLSQALPPVYCEFIGHAFAASLECAA